MTFSTFQDAIAERSKVNATQADLIAYVRQLSVDAEGSKTVLYSGYINGVEAYKIVNDLPTDVRHIGKTMSCLFV